MLCCKIRQSRQLRAFLIKQQRTLISPKTPYSCVILEIFYIMMEQVSRHRNATPLGMGSDMRSKDIEDVFRPPTQKSP